VIYGQDYIDNAVEIKRIKDIRPPPIHKIDRGKKGEDVRGGYEYQSDDGSSEPPLLKKRENVSENVSEKKSLRIHLLAPEDSKYTWQKIKDKHKSSVLPHALPILYMILGEIAKVLAVHQCAHSADPRCYQVLTCRCCPLGLGLGLGLATDQHDATGTCISCVHTSSLRPHTLVA